MAVDGAALGRITSYLEQHRGNEPPKRHIIRASMAGDCSRKIGYRLLGFPGQEPTTNELVTFEIGHSYHRMLQGWLVAMGWIADDSFLEVPLADPGARVQGSCDGITVRLDKEGEPSSTGTRRVVEIKSMTNVAQERYGKESAGAYTRLEKPRDYHLDQANLYAHLWNLNLATWNFNLDGMQGWDPVLDRVEHVTLIYMGKDTHEMPLKVFTQAISAKRIERLTDKFGRIWAAVDREELPERDYNPFSGFPPCNYCAYQALCLTDAAESL